MTEIRRIKIPLPGGVAKIQRIFDGVVKNFNQSQLLTEALEVNSFHTFWWLRVPQPPDMPAGSFLKP
ncbi:hypothetical protein ACM40_13775 [Chryseobacterium sp. BLS98]|nr:hypothetical protein ACM40_13775 [Chryseobacterium sp. BLS98]